MPLASILKKTKENSFKKLPDKRQRKGTSNILKDITNIDFSLGYENQESPSPTVIPEPDFGGLFSRFNICIFLISTITINFI